MLTRTVRKSFTCSKNQVRGRKENEKQLTAEKGRRRMVAANDIVHQPG